MVLLVLLVYVKTGVRGQFSGMDVFPSPGMKIVKSKEWRVKEYLDEKYLAGTRGLKCIF